ncbi:MAG: tRNA uracil 4-sulfurtransferase ThiI [Gammaproteobacteria bacterium]|jgi:thiamine biosynthesis protein ThiI|nr:tRNA 4-thiouridine(8) synthase ThiI [Gammaproteobacteria bacterium]MDP6097177.1 tRNA uracil 4-sulfurtransferase ThiI [Gammaproteobacteria bacterium]HJO12682.1 tRNA uracil 4-sulfurtransferase ThiI [Gammaproteobacteria bacterium]
MLFLVKLFPEITIKSRPVRRRFIRQLRKNLRAILGELDSSVSVSGEWDVLEVEFSRNDKALAVLIINKLINTPGISSILQVEKFPLPDMDGILELCKTFFTEALRDKTFAVRCKRKGRHGFKSIDVERIVGGGLNQHTEAAGVKLVNPDVTVNLEIHDEELFLVSNKFPGLGGFPLGCQDSVLSLISGGFDSSVSSYLCIKRGLLTHYCFFNLGGRAHELAVKEVALFLWMKYHSSHRVKFISVPFQGVVEEILTKVKNSQMGVVLKRMMLRAAERVAQELQIQALVTGESVSQVSSQTLPNLAVIDSVCDTMVLRPLSTSDKQQIIDQARAIGTEDFSKDIPEYCGVISVKPTTRARIERIEREESNFDFSVLDKAIENANHQLITKLAEDLMQDATPVDVVSELGNDAILIDIRHPSELELKPLDQSLIGEGVELLQIPFYKLRTTFDSLDRDKRYFLYCDKGMMSKLHAANLSDEGHDNVGVFSPPD